jgi:hypothetical protein
MDLCRTRCRISVVRFVMFALLTGHACAAAQHPVRSEKESRTPAQKKIDSQLLYELYRVRGQAKEKGVPEGATGVRLDQQHRALVDVRAEVSAGLEQQVRSLGGTILSVSAPYRSIVGWIPLTQLERLAADPAVHAIVPAAEAALRRRNPQSRVPQ